jgi:tripartite-type tricarboxylate transporter receptor subunit TctC
MLQKERKRKTRLIVGLAFFALLFAFSSSPIAASDFPYEKGDTITLVVPFKPGGGFDTYARLLAPPLEKALEKMGGVNLSVIVENQPGAGGRTGHISVYRAKPDGRTLLIAHQGAMPYQILVYNAPFKIEAYTWLAAIAKATKGIVVRDELPINNFKDLIKRSHEEPTLMASAGKGDDPHIDPILVAALLREAGIEWKIDFVQYHGTAPARASLARDETEALFTAIGSMLPVVDSGDARLIVAFSHERDSRCPETPTVIEQNIPRGSEMIDAISIYWTLVGPPQLPEATTQVLREAAATAINSAEFRDRAAKAKRTVNYLPGEKIRRIAIEKLEVIRKYEDLIKKEME